jgi:hypothetical protein
VNKVLRVLVLRVGAFDLILPEAQAQGYVRSFAGLAPGTDQPPNLVGTTVDGVAYYINGRDVSGLLIMPYNEVPAPALPSPRLGSPTRHSGR